MPRPRLATPLIALIAAAAAAAVLIIVFVVRDEPFVGPLLSCFDFAEEQTGAAQSPACAPFIFPEAEAARLLDTTELRQISSGLYLIADEDTWDGLTKAEIWRSLSAFTSAVVGVRGVNADIYFIVTPASRDESALLLDGKYPDERIVATAIYNERTTKRLAPTDVPAGHFANSYTLSVR